MDQPDAPGYFVHDAIMNRKERASLDESMAGTKKKLSLKEVVKLRNEGAQIVDTREALDFAGAHLAGSINIAVDGKYATWAGTVLDKEAPIVVIADEERVAESIMRLGRIGFDHVAGYLEGGMETLQNHENLIEKTQRITAAAAAESTNCAILDVRSTKEHEQGHIEGSLSIPLNHLEERIEEVPHDKDVIVHCEGGYRSSIATSILQKHGYSNVFDMVGGYKAWVGSGLPVAQQTTAES